MIYDFKTGGLIENASENNMVSISKSLYNPYTGSLNGVVIVSFDEETIYKTYNKFINDNVRFSVITKDGYIISDSFRDRVGSTDHELLKLISDDTILTKGNCTYNGKKYWIMASEIPGFNATLIELVNFDVIKKRNI